MEKKMQKDNCMICNYKFVFFDFIVFSDPYAFECNSILNAARNNRKDVVDLILSYYNQFPSNVMLIVNTSLGRIEKVTQIIDQDVDISYNNSEALILAIMHDHNDIAKLLIQNGINIHADEDDPIRASVWKQNMEITKLLLDAGSDISSKDYEVIERAISYKNKQLLKLLTYNREKIPNYVNQYIKDHPI